MKGKRVELLFEQQTAVLKIFVEVNFENSNPIKEKSKELISKNNVENLIIDLSSVPYLDSSGIGFVLSIFKFMRDKKGKLILLNPNDKVKRVLEVTKIDTIIKIFYEKEKAVEELS
ncbi:MAG: STAS domain-containing protein [Bacillota bacterium]